MTEAPVAATTTDEPGEAGRSHVDGLIAAGLIGAYVAVRISILARFKPFVTTDSPSYGPVAGHPYLRTLSFAGNAPRPWTAPLLYNLIHNEWARAAIQWSIGTVAWSVLAYGIWLHLKSRTARIIGLVLLLGLALNASVYTWDYAILSESLSINLGLLAFGLFAIWLKKRWWWALAAMVVVAFLWTFTRQDVLPIVGIFVLAVAIAAIVVKRTARTQKIGAFAALAVLLGGMLWATLLIPRIDVGYANWGEHFRLTESTFLYRLRFVILPDPKEREVYYRQFGMPTCPGLQGIADLKAWRMGQFNDDYRNCPELRAWVIKNGQSSGYRYALVQPQHFLTRTVDTLPDMLRNNPGVDAKPIAVLPRSVDQVLYPPKQWTLPVTGLVAVVSLGVALAAGAWRRRKWLLLSGLGLCLVALANAAATENYSVGEYVRFGMQEAVLLRVGLILLFTVAVESVVLWRRWPAEVSQEESSPQSEPSPSPTESSVEAPHEGRERRNVRPYERPHHDWV
jgi:hypothetical protein